MTTSSNTEVSDERLAEMLAGLEGTTPGPWRHYVPDAGYTDDYVVTDHADHAPDEKHRFRHLVATTEAASLQQQATGKHIARCDPDTIRAIVTELLSRRSANTSAGGVEVKALEWRAITSPREDGPPEPTGDLEALDHMGDYSVTFDADEEMLETPWVAYSPMESLGHFDCPEDAISACNRWRREAILSAIEPVQKMHELPSLHPADGEPVAHPLGNECPACHGTGQPGGVLGGPELGLCHQCAGQGFTRPSNPVSAEVTFQDRVAQVHVALFHDDPTDIAERRDRFYEEATEAVQSIGMTEADAHALVAYTFSRPVGAPEKEIGAAALTLASLCVIGGYDMMACAEADLAALVTPEKIAKVRAKRATRHGRGPLPGHDASLNEVG